jgi:hypothetical protein
MPRFSIWQLLVATAFIAAGCFALLNASAWVASALFCGVALLLSAAILFAIYRDGERRAYWIGFAVLGWAYLFLCFGGFLSATSLSWHGNLTALLAGALYDRAYAGQAVPAVPGTTVPTITYSPSPYYPAYPTTGNMPNAYTNPAVPMTGSVTFAAVAMQVPPGPDREQFLYVAHALWTLLIATCGGWLAAWLHTTRLKSSEPDRSA